MSMTTRPQTMDSRSSGPAALAYTLVQHALLEMRSSRAKIRDTLAVLPVLSKEVMAGVDLEEPCPICLVPLSTVFAEEEAEKKKTKKKKSDTNEEDKEEEEVLIGVTKLEGCGHVFCRRDLTEWIRSQHGSCPTCRHVFLHIRPLSAESDDESSDGGEYIPNLDDLEDEDEDAFNDVDGFTDADADDFPTEGMDVDFGDIWGEHSDDLPTLGVGLEVDVDGDNMMGDPDMDDADEDEYEAEENDASFEWGLTDGDSESMTSSEAGDITLGDEVVGVAAANVPDREVSVSVHENDDANAKEGEGISVDASTSTLDVSQQDKGTSSS